MSTETIQFGESVIGFPGFFSESECQELINNSECKGYDEAAINTISGQKMVKKIRNNDRILFDDLALAERLLAKLEPYLDEQIGRWTLLALNERFRFYRYHPEQYFKWHRDGAFTRSPSERSMTTFMVYLNDDFEGGNTDFRRFSVKPQIGMGLLFPHYILHQGSTVISGIKYVLRTDVMYKTVL